ncbi:hypothetical protein JNW90_17530 [Micromonospora sp. STR1s_5]|nr:hypothetical protein [Micromonospora sp. STR1s_5]
MSEDTPRVISVRSVDSVTFIDGGLAIAVQTVTPDDQPFAVLLSKELAVDLLDKLDQALTKGKRPASGKS